MVAIIVGRAVIAALIILGIYATTKFILDASKKGSSNVR